uniref:Uncharacterized protein n=1 Tax=Microcebus murinus TaxID=30608 RepID=A0A8C5YGS6_MICMU
MLDLSFLSLIPEGPHYTQDGRAVNVPLGENANFPPSLKEKKLVIFFKGTFYTHNC